MCVWVHWISSLKFDSSLFWQSLSPTNFATTCLVCAFRFRFLSTLIRIWFFFRFCLVFVLVDVLLSVLYFFFLAIMCKLPKYMASFYNKFIFCFGLKWVSVCSLLFFNGCFQGWLNIFTLICFVCGFVIFFYFLRSVIQQLRLCIMCVDYLFCRTTICLLSLTFTLHVSLYWRLSFYLFAIHNCPTVKLWIW